ncbi:MAG: HAMP domain-containing histidine kinase [Lachnospiraceae bacterium]|jgi:signal transduction histidine kinase|nr:HAMP domain-containing histidine kinase [Lachnospiraceae bacterium]
MKLYQKIMVLIFVILAGCGTLCGWILGENYEKQQFARAADAKVSGYESARYAMEWLWQTEPGMKDSRETAKQIMDRLFQKKLFDGCIWVEDGEIICDSSLYEISWDEGWREEGRFEETEYVLERAGDEYWIVIGSALPWVGEGNYLFSVQDLTEIHGEAQEFIRQFSLIWLLFVTAASLLGAVAARLVLLPMGSLARAAGEISRGNYKVRAEVRRRDETGRLAQTFNLMAEQVEGRIRALTLAGEEKERLLGSLAHEMRTPMTSILGYSDTLLHVKLGEREKERALRNIYEQAGYVQRLSAKLMELMALHQNESISMKEERIGMLLEKAVLMAGERRPGQDFKLYLEEDFSVCGDKDLLVSLFVNLLDNGAKASEPGQEIQAVVQKGRVMIRDFGKGMAKEELAKIREPFYRVVSSGREGLGLGLAICEQIARLHHAKLQFESREGEGTVVTTSF